MTSRIKSDLRLTSVYLTEEQVKALDRIAHDENPVSPNRASVIRRAIDQFIEPSKDDATKQAVA